MSKIFTAEARRTQRIYEDKGKLRNLDWVPGFFRSENSECCVSLNAMELCLL